MKIYYEHWIFKLPYVRRFLAMAILPNVILVKCSKEIWDKYYKGVEDHEKAHHAQSIFVGGAIRFWFIYLGMLIWEFLKCWNFMKAYRNIKFERDAREWE